MLEIVLEWLARQEWIELVKLGVAALVGGVIGLERETAGQAAGLRTTILVTVSACLLMQLSIYMPQIHIQMGFDGDSLIRTNPSRIASYTIAGMGFLGAGTIIKGRGSIRGLTTAAGLWLVTALGLAVGAGLFLPALVTTVIAVIVLFWFRFFRPNISRDQHTVLSIRCCCDERPIEEIREVLSSFTGLSIEFTNYTENRETRDATYTFRLMSKDYLNWSQMLDELRYIPSIKEFTWKEAEVP